MTQGMIRPLPHSIEAEQAVLGALMLDNDAIDRIGGLNADDFFQSGHRVIFSAIVKLIEAGKPADPLTVGDALPAIGVRYLTDLANNTPSSANVGRYAELVKDRAKKRSLAFLANEIGEMAYAENAPPAEILIDKLQAQVDALVDTRTQAEPAHVADDLTAYIEELEQRREGRSRAIPLGFPDLDELFSGGIRRGEVVLVAARPKTGKSALAFAIARNVSVDHSVLVLEMEMPKVQIHDRNTAALGRIDLSRLLSPGQMTEDDWGRVTVAVEKLMKLNLYIDDQPALRLLDVRSKARTVKRKHGLDLLVIDYLQLMEAEGDNRNAQIESITRGIKALAKELNIGVLLLSQLNRELERRPNKRPLPSDLRDSGAVEQDCDAAIFLYRDEVYNPDTMDKGIVEANVGLNRQGRTGTVGLTYIGDQMRFESLPAGTRFGQKPAKSPMYSLTD